MRIQETRTFPGACAYRYVLSRTVLSDGKTECHTVAPVGPCQPKGSIVEEDQTGRREALAEKVERLKRERDAVVLAHYYVPAETQRLADYVGDSFYLARLAKTLDAPNQMRTVAVSVSWHGGQRSFPSGHHHHHKKKKSRSQWGGGSLAPNPRRRPRVLMPEPAADCPMAHMVRQEDVDRVRAEVPDLAVVAYVNTTAEVKRWADVCVTSSNAIKVVLELPEKNILFIPDMNLGRYVAEQVPEKHVILNPRLLPHAQQGREVGGSRRWSWRTRTPW